MVINLQTIEGDDKDNQVATLDGREVASGGETSAMVGKLRGAYHITFIVTDYHSF